MFWKFIEFLVRLVYFKRFRQADRIGKAVELAGKGESEAALGEMERLEAKLHPSLRSIWGLTKGRILLAEGRLDEAERAFIFSAKADPSNAKAHLDLAVLAGRRFRFDDARERLEKIKSEAGEKIRKEAAEILDLLEKVTSGEREKEFFSRAKAFSERPIGPNGETPGLPADFKLLDKWIDQNRDKARELADEMALLVGQSEVVRRDASWRVALSIEESLIVFPDNVEFYPFKKVAQRLARDDARLELLLPNK